jgi:hypothetical protein
VDDGGDPVQAHPDSRAPAFLNSSVQSLERRFNDGPIDVAFYGRGENGRQGFPLAAVHELVAPQKTTMSTGKPILRSEGMENGWKSGENSQIRGRRPAL